MFQNFIYIDKSSVGCTVFHIFVTVKIEIIFRKYIKKLINEMCTSVSIYVLGS